MPSVLGLGCGQPDGSAEILLKAALMAAEAHGTAELVRLDDLRLPDDAWWFWERLVACDGLVVSAPIISRTASRMPTKTARLTMAWPMCSSRMPGSAATGSTFT